MTKLKALWHTIMFMWVGRFGGSINGGNYYLLRTITIHDKANVCLSGLTLNNLHGGALFKMLHSNIEFLDSNVKLKGELYIAEDESNE